MNDISCGDAHNCALVGSGIVYSWGNNSVGQLGIAYNSYTEITKPRQISITSGHSIVQVACGANFSSALSSEISCLQCSTLYNMMHTSNLHSI